MQNNTNLKNPHCSRNSIQKMTIDEPSALGDFKFMKPHENLSLEDMEGEVWKDIPRFEGFYQVSNIGRVKAISRTYKNSIGRNRPYKERILKLHLNIDGYLTVFLYKDGGRTVTTAHILVISAFKGGCSMTIDHINMIKTDNRVENLECVSNRENMSRAYQKKRNLPTGVRQRNGRYAVSIYIGKLKKGVSFGTYDMIEEASRIYKLVINDLDNYEKYLPLVHKSPYGPGIRKQKNKKSYLSFYSDTYIGSFSTIEEASKAREDYICSINIKNQTSFSI